MEEFGEDHVIKNNGYISPSSSPPTPPSPLPISVGPGNQKYSFSLSPSPSPPFSPPSSSHGSANNLPFLLETLSTPATAQTPSAFSLDRRAPDKPSVSSDSHKEDISESEPILSQSESLQKAEESSSASSSSLSSPSSEITAVRGADDLQNLDVDETSHLMNADQPQCRICFDIGGEDLIAPCNCRGTQKYVHRSCLDHWRSSKEGFAFSHCTECRVAFLLRANVPADRWWLRLKFQFLVARDHAFIFVVVQLIVALLAVLVYKFYGEELREMFGYDQHPYGFYIMAGLAIVLVGLLYGFFIAIICGQRISDRHYHVLAIQELTKEYVVEDRESNKNVPELDQSHISELRMLGLY